MPQDFFDVHLDLAFERIISTPAELNGLHFASDSWMTQVL